MLDTKVFNRFVAEINKSHQQFTLWFHTHNNFASQAKIWSQKAYSRFKFFEVTTASLQHGWVLSLYRLFDKPYFQNDKSKPRVSLDFICEKVENEKLVEKIKKELAAHKEVIDSLESFRHNVLAHNDVGYEPSDFKAGIEDLYEWLEEKCEEIKLIEKILSDRKVNVKNNERIAKEAASKIFSDLLNAEK